VLQQIGFGEIGFRPDRSERIYATDESPLVQNGKLQYHQMHISTKLHGYSDGCQHHSYIAEWSRHPTFMVWTGTDSHALSVSSLWDRNARERSVAKKQPFIDLCKGLIGAIFSVRFALIFDSPKVKARSPSKQSSRNGT
jgi:hypothetical protein